MKLSELLKCHWFNVDHATVAKEMIKDRFFNLHLSNKFIDDFNARDKWLTYEYHKILCVLSPFECELVDIEYDI